MTRNLKTLGIIFMGGKARRLGGIDKSEITIGGVSCFDRVYRNLSKTTAQIALSKPYGGTHAAAPVIPDWPTADSQSSPALALLGCLSYAASAGFDQILTSSVDTPFLPDDFFENLSSGGPSSAAKTGLQIHGLHARWSCALLPTLKTHILGGEHGITRLHKMVHSGIVTFKTHPFDPFFNINLPEDLEAAQTLAQTYGV